MRSAAIERISPRIGSGARSQDRSLESIAQPLTADDDAQQAADRQNRSHEEQQA
jgi:hypothetical protein